MKKKQTKNSQRKRTRITDRQTQTHSHRHTDLHTQESHKSIKSENIIYKQRPVTLKNTQKRKQAPQDQEQIQYRDIFRPGLSQRLGLEQT